MAKESIEIDAFSMDIIVHKKVLRNIFVNENHLNFDITATVYYPNLIKHKFPLV